MSDESKVYIDKSVLEKILEKGDKADRESLIKSATSMSIFFGSLNIGLKHSGVGFIIRYRLLSIFAKAFDMSK